MGKRRRRVTASKIIGRDVVNPNDARARLAERDAREQRDTRTVAERNLGDPPIERSALAQRSE